MSCITDIYSEGSLNLNSETQSRHSSQDFIESGPLQPKSERKRDKLRRAIKERNDRLAISLSDLQSRFSDDIELMRQHIHNKRMQLKCSTKETMRKLKGEPYSVHGPITIEMGSDVESSFMKNVEEIELDSCYVPAHPIPKSALLNREVVTFKEKIFNAKSSLSRVDNFESTCEPSKNHGFRNTESKVAPDDADMFLDESFVDFFANHCFSMTCFDNLQQANIYDEPNREHSSAAQDALPEKASQGSQQNLSPASNSFSSPDSIPSPKPNDNQVYTGGQEDAPQNETNHIQLKFSTLNRYPAELQGGDKAPSPINLLPNTSRYVLEMYPPPCQSSQTSEIQLKVLFAWEYCDGKFIKTTCIPPDDENFEWDLEKDLKERFSLREFVRHKRLELADKMYDWFKEHYLKDNRFY